MINNLGSHSPLNIQADSAVSAEKSLFDMLGKTSGLDQALHQEDILSLLSGDAEADFSKILSGENKSEDNKSTESESQELTLKSLSQNLTQNLDKSLLNSSEIKNLELVLTKLDSASDKATKVDLSQIAELIKENPKLSDKITNLLKIQSSNESENKVLKEITKLIAKDSSTKVTALNLNESIENKDKINKLLGMSSEDLIQSKNNKKDTSAPKLNVEAKNNLSKHFMVKDNNIIKNQQPNINLKSLNETKVNELEQIVTENIESASDLSDTVKLDSSTVIKTNKINQTSKTMDLSQMLSKTDSTNDVIAKIQDYVIQSRVSSDPNVSLTFNHAELGNVHLNVQKLGADNLAVTITSNNSEAVKFFTENKAELLQTLTNSGLNISDVKLENTSSANTNKDSNSNNQSFAQTKGDTPNSKQGEQDKESKRREELWELLNKEVA